MLGNLKRIYRALRLKAADGQMNAQPPVTTAPIPTSLSEARARLGDAFGGSQDIIYKFLNCNAALVVFIDGMVDRELVDHDVIRPMMEAASTAADNLKDICFLEQKVLVAAEISREEDWDACVNAILQGQTLIFLEGSAHAMRVSLQKWRKRSIEESKSEDVVRGPREGFTENIKDNIVQVRRKIHDSNLIFENMKIGRQTKTSVAFCYIRGVADRKIIDEVRKRLQNIHTDVVLESAYLETYITDAPFSIFPTVGHTERPDTVAGKLLEGRIAIFCDGTPFVLTVPNLFVEYIQTPEDYYKSWLSTPLLRLIRLISLFASATTPAFYVTFLCFHQDVIPFQLLITIASASEGVPFPPIMECLILILTFELIREGGIRMPKSLGQAISIVGALIIGQAAVQAGLVSAPAVIVIAATAICTFIVPKLDDTMLIIRLSLLFAANMVGFLGIVLTSFLFIAYLCSLKSFGVPYLSPLAPFGGHDMEDVFIRMPLWSMLSKSETVTRKYIKNERGNLTK